MTGADGKVWTIRILRGGDPDPSVITRSKGYWLDLGFNRLRRTLSRDRTWDVWLLETGAEGAGGRPRIQSREADEEAAVNAAVRVARRVEAGSTG